MCAAVRRLRAAVAARRAASGPAVSARPSTLPDSSRWWCSSAAGGSVRRPLEHHRPRTCRAPTNPTRHVYLPGRNPLLLVKADVWCRLHGVGQLALGSLASNPFADASDAFFAPFRGGHEPGRPGHVEMVRPLAGLDKRQVMQLGARMPLGLTFSCLSPAGRSALRQLQQMRRAAAGVSR